MKGDAVPPVGQATRGVADVVRALRHMVSYLYGRSALLEDVRYLFGAYEDLAADPQVLRATLAAARDVWAHAFDRGRAEQIRQSTGLISFADEGGRPYDSHRAARLCRRAADTIDARPLTAPVAVSKLRWRLGLEQRRGINPAGARPERARYDAVHGLRSRTLLVIVTARLARAYRALADELLSDRGTGSIEQMLSETTRAGFSPSDDVARKPDDAEALLAGLLEQIGIERVYRSVLESFDEDERAVFSAVYSRAARDLCEASKSLLETELPPRVTADERARLIEEPLSPWAVDNFTPSIRYLARRVSSTVDISEVLRHMIGDLSRALTLVIGDVFRALRDGGCPPEDWSAVARASSSLLSLATALRAGPMEKVFLEQRHSPARINPYRAGRDDAGAWKLEAAVPILRNPKLPENPGSCTAFQYVSPPDPNGRPGNCGEVRFFDAPFELAIGIAEHLRRTGRIFQ